jgi:hypothetical protein
MSIFAQDIKMEYYLNKCISLLEKPVPDGFQRIGKTGYRNEEGITVSVKNGIITLSTFSSAFLTTNETHEFNALLYDYVENTNWQYYSYNKLVRVDIYF